MYGFKVFVSTLIVLMTIITAIATSKAAPKDSVRNVAYTVIIIETLSLIAIWG